jgi:hypothetical protein
MFPEARSVGAWLKHGWFVAVAYVAGFFVMLALWGWQPTQKRERPAPAPASSAPASVPAQRADRVQVPERMPHAVVRLTPSKRA